MERTITLGNVELNDIHDRPDLMTSLLYKKLLQKLNESIELINQGSYFDANRAMQLCNDILTRLGFGIKYEAGVMGDQLEALYRYMFDKIFQANLEKDTSVLLEIYEIAQELDEAWTDAMNRASSLRENTTSDYQVAPKRFNPYQKREIEQEVYQYEKDKQEIHLKK